MQSEGANAEGLDEKLAGMSMLLQRPFRFATLL
jgi:hypothetical protein